MKDKIRQEQWDKHFWEKNNKVGEEIRGKKIQMHQSINTVTTNVR